MLNKINIITLLVANKRLFHSDPTGSEHCSSAGIADGKSIICSMHKRRIAIS